VRRLYVVTRGDLSPGQQAVQAIHAALLLASPERWGSTTIALLAAAGLPDLLALASRAEDRGAHHALFHEPDLDGAPTALAIAGEDGRRLCARLPLAYG
jgi:hypothetical protein